MTCHAETRSAEFDESQFNTPKRRPAAPDALLYDVDDVVRRLGISRAQVFRLMASGELPRRKIGRRTKVPRAAVEAFAATVTQ